MSAPKYKVGDIFEYTDYERYDEEQYYLVLNVDKYEGYHVAVYEILCLNDSKLYSMWQTSRKEKESKWVA